MCILLTGNAASFHKVAYFHYKNVCNNSKFCKILGAKKSKKSSTKNILNRKTDWDIRPKKSNFFSENQPGENFFIIYPPT